MRKMIEEAIWLTDQNAKDTKRQIREEINHKKSKAQKEYQEAIQKQRELKEKYDRESQATTGRSRTTGGKRAS